MLTGLERGCVEDQPQHARNALRLTLRAQPRSTQSSGEKCGLDKVGFDGHTVHHQSPPSAHTSGTSWAVFIALIRFIATRWLLPPQPVEPIAETHIRLEDGVTIGPDGWLGDCGPKTLVEV